MSLGLIARADQGRTTITTMECSIVGCSRTAKTRGWCSGHYQRWYKTGDPGPAQFKEHVRRPCVIEDCGEWAQGRGLCKRHYWAWRTHGDPRSVRPANGSIPPDERFLSFVNRVPDGCWLWTGTCTEKGYGHFSTGDRSGPRTIAAHRWAYQRWVGPLPDRDHVLDHICRVRRCVNPEHLRIVTWRENALLGVEDSRR